MKHASWLKLSIAAGFAGLLLFGVTLLAHAVPQAAIGLSCAPSPPYSISRGMVETMTWHIDPGVNTPDYVEFKLFDPDNVIVDAATYSGTAALSVTRTYTVPTSPKEGSYWARIAYFSMEAGQEAEAAVKFYIAERGNLHVFKFNDVNGNRILDPGEEGVPAVRIKLRTPFGDEVARLTDATGWAAWDKVAIGTYMITETVPAGWEAVLPPTATAAVHIDATTEIIFANRQIGNLHVFKFEDANGNSSQDSGEGPVQGVTITVQSPQGDLWTKTTGADGQANWDAIPAGSYRVTETLPAGWTAILPPAVPATVTLNATANVIFANRQIGNLHVFKFEDANGNSSQDSGEGPVQGVTITVQSPQGDLWTKTTGADGQANWDAIPAGSYRVTETLPAGWTAILPPAVPATVTLNATANVIFANRQIGNLHVFKFEDANGNSSQDSGEGPVQGVTITVQSPQGDLWTKTTGADGQANWDAIPAGSYRVTETLPAGWTAILPPAVPATVTLNATANVIFANRQLGNLHVFKFEDANGNSSQDSGEGPVQGVTITVQSPQGDLWTKTTGADGQANWDAIPAGSYRVTETLPAGWTAILPPAVPATVTVNATANVIFANRLAANSCIIGRKIDDLHRGLPGWTIHARPRDAQGPVLTTVTDGHGDFYFAGLTSGWWTVWEEMQPGWAPVTDATFNVPLPSGPTCVEVGFKNRQACARDLYESDDTADTATLILPNGAPQKHTLEPPSDLDWVTFNAVAGAIYTIRTDNLLGSTDTYLTLYGAGDTSIPLAYNDDIAPGDKHSEIVWRAPATGRYFARVRDFYQSGTRGCMAYDLILTAQYRTYLPLIVAPPPPPPATPTPTPPPPPTITATPSPTLSPTPTRTPVPTPPPLVIPGLRHPKGIGINLSTHHLYVASRDTDVVYEVDPTANPATVVRSIPVGHEPFGVAVNSTTGKVYVANFLGNSLSVISRVTGTVIKTIPFPSLYGEPTYVAINENTNRIYVPLHKGGRLAVIRGDTDTLVTTIAVGAGAWGVAVDPTYNRVFVSCRDDQPQRVWTIDGAANAVMWDRLIYPGGTPYALAVDALLGRLYVSFAPEGDNPRQVLVYRLPETEPSLLTAVLVGNGGADGGGGVVANPATHHVFVTNSMDDSVTVFDGVTNMVLDWVPVGDDPQCVAVDPGSSIVWVGNRGSNNVSGIPDGY